MEILGNRLILHRNLTNYYLLLSTQLTSDLTVLLSPHHLLSYLQLLNKIWAPVIFFSFNFLPSFNFLSSLFSSLILASFIAILIFPFSFQFSLFSPHSQFQFHSTPIYTMYDPPTLLLASWGLSSLPASIWSFCFRSLAQDIRLLFL